MENKNHSYVCNVQEGGECNCEGVKLPISSEEWEGKLLEYVFRIYPVAYFPNPIPSLTASQEILIKEMNNYVRFLFSQQLSEYKERIVRDIKEHGIERGGEWGDGYNDAVENVLEIL